MLNDEDFMELAYQQALTAFRADEVPVGAVLVKGGQVVAVGHNAPIQQQDPSAHAEIMAIRSGAKILENYRLVDTTLYVTLEPCFMCMGALVHARVSRIVFGAFDLKSGAVKLVNESGLINHQCRSDFWEHMPSILLLQRFFKEKREKLKAKKQ